jgi:hypothetical protein
MEGLADRPAAVSDPVLAAVLHEAAVDPEVLGVLLGGSRGADCADERSDYDVEIVLTDSAYDRRHESGRPEPGKHRLADGQILDVRYKCPRELGRIAANPGWWTPGYVTTRVLLDKTGAVAPALVAIVTMPEDRARADAAGFLDAYLNGFYRSLKAWRRGNELGGRLEAVESVMYLARALFALERRWTPYHDRLERQLETLAIQGWAPGELRQAILSVLRTGSPRIQQQLCARVEELVRSRGLGHAFDRWDDDVPEVMAWTFE